MQHLSAFIVGLLFAIGLGISGMTQPEKVIGFLDFFGTWDPTLLFVMGSAVPMYFCFFRAVRGYAPILTARFEIPTRTQIDWRLLSGSALFGIGWALAGFCPGPAIVSVGSGASGPLVFVGAMVGGMLLFALFDQIVVSGKAAPSAATRGAAAGAIADA
ncbi:MAG TPA: DUF6691 family protein [Kofleriaceae bacterium]|nr:DUF6691 family protein [Kofleriaceae bacterium]